MIEIIPAILTNNATELLDYVKKIQDSVDVNLANIKRIQIDVLDGQFADNKTVDPSLLSDMDTNLSLDFHLMVKEPIHWIEKSANAGADRIIAQIEMMSSQIEFVKRVQETGLYVGLALDLDTPISKLDPVVLTNLDVVLLMAVKAGWGGQEFNSKVLSKIKELDEIRVRDKTPFKICVDGGETENTIYKTHYEGADEVAIGRRIIDGNISENIRLFQESA